MELILGIQPFLGSIIVMGIVELIICFLSYTIGFIGSIGSVGYKAESLELRAESREHGAKSMEQRATKLKLEIFVQRFHTQNSIFSF